MNGLCASLFLSPSAREQDDNLQFVRDRLLRSDVDVAGLLELYQQVHLEQPVKDDEANPLVSVLRLSGITRSMEGMLHPRNLIYSQVFDCKWIRSNMPEAEVRRQKAAYRRGLLRANAVATAVLAVFGALAVIAFRSERRAERAANEARRKSKDLQAAL